MEQTKTFFFTLKSKTYLHAKFKKFFFQVLVIMVRIQGDYETERRLITSSETIARSNQLTLEDEETILETNRSKSNWQEFVIFTRIILTLS